MRTVQLIFLVLFAVFAVLTLLLQLWYGHVTGRSTYEDKQQDPKAMQYRSYGAKSAICSALFLLAALVVGILTK